MKLQIGMHVLLNENIDDYGEDSGKIKEITSHLPDYNNQRAYELDNEKDSIYIASDFQYCVEYPNLKIE